MILVFDHKQGDLSYRNGCLLVGQAGGSSRRVPVSQLELVVIHGSPVIAAGVWRELALAGVPVVLHGARGRASAILLGSGLAKQLPSRRRQHRCADDPACTTRLAAWFVESKLASQRIARDDLFSWLGKDNGACFSEYDRAHEAAVRSLAEADSTSTVMGIEGSASRAWFRLLAGALPQEWRFSGRNRRPPRDPVNAMLSLGYTLLAADVRQQLLAYGFDTSLGFLHSEYPGREGLVLDCCEPWRGGVDAMVLRLMQEKCLRPEDFYYRREEGCRLAKRARPVFYEAWARQREAWPGVDGSTRPLRQRIGGMAQSLRKRLGVENEDDG